MIKFGFRVWKIINGAWAPSGWTIALNQEELSHPPKPFIFRLSGERRSRPVSNPRFVIWRSFIFYHINSYVKKIKRFCWSKAYFLRDETVEGVGTSRKYWIEFIFALCFFIETGKVNIVKEILVLFWRMLRSKVYFSQKALFTIWLSCIKKRSWPCLENS